MDSIFKKFFRQDQPGVAYTSYAAARRILKDFFLTFSRKKKVKPHRLRGGG